MLAWVAAWFQVLWGAVPQGPSGGAQAHRSFDPVLWCVCMFSGLMHRHIYVGKWCITGFDKCWAYTMKFLLTVLLFFSYIKLGRSNAIHSGIIIFPLCPNIYRNITSIWHINSAFTDFNNHVINKKWYFYSPSSIFKGSWTANLHQSNKARTFYFSEFITSLWKRISLERLQLRVKICKNVTKFAKDVDTL